MRTGLAYLLAIHLLPNTALAAGPEALFSRGLRLPEAPPVEAPAILETAPLVFSGTVVWVSDGDTFVVRHGEESTKIRLHEVDCPEKAQPYGEDAKAFVMDLILKKTVSVQVRQYDMYGRALAAIHLPDGRDLRHVLLEAGLAWWYRYFSDDASLGALEAEARAAGLGLWADPDPEPPWDYRYRNRRPASPPN